TYEPQGMNHGEENHGEENARIPAAGADRSARSGSGVDRDCGADRPAHKQNKAQADAILAEIRSAWPKPSEDAEYQPGPDSAKAEAIHWHGLLKSGIAASRIQRAALHYLSEVSEDQWQRSFVRFLTGRLPDYLDPDQPDLFIPEDEPPAANDNPT